MIKFRNAKKVNESIPLLIEIAGPSWSGKTYSALRLATGIGGPVFFVDTEEGRGAHYRHKFDYQYVKMQPPFTYRRYMEHVKAAIEAGAKVVIIDSISHGHEGEGGYLQQHDHEVDRMMRASRQSNPKRDAFNAAGWIKPSRDKNDFVLALGRLALDVPLIFCFRAKEKIKLLKDEKGRTQIVDAGWQPITSAGIDFEMTLRLMLPANSGGVPDLTFESTKVLEEHRAIIGEDTPLSEEMGQALAQWAANAPKAGPVEIDVRDRIAFARNVAEQGTDAYRQWFNALTNDERKVIQPWHEEFKNKAARADNPDTDDVEKVPLYDDKGNVLDRYTPDEWLDAYNDFGLQLASDADAAALQEAFKNYNADSNKLVGKLRGI